MTLQATLVALVVVGAVCGALIVATVLARLERHRRSRVLARLTAPHRMLLLDVASGEDDDGRSAAALADLTGRAWEGMRGAVTGLLSKVRGEPAEQLVEILAAHGDIDAARVGTRSRSAMARARSAHLLGSARTHDAVPDLLPLLTDRAAEVRLVAARALGQIADPRTAAPLLRSVIPPQGRRAGPVGVPAWIVADGLLAMGPAVTTVVVAGLGDEDPLVRDVAASVSANSMMPALLPVLRARLAVETEPTVRAQIASALGRLGHPQDAALLTAHASASVDPGLRRACVGALGELGVPAAEPVLTALLADEDRRLSSIAADALIALGPVGHRALEAAVGQGEAAARAARGALELATLREA